MLNRRKVLAGMLGLGALGAAGTGLLVRQNNSRSMKRYDLVASERNIELIPGHQTPAWTYGGSAPGKEIRGRQGDWLHVRFHNNLPEPTTIHWHGLRIPLEMDGVPYLSQLPVLPGEYFDYQFQLPDAGSFWYHPHTSSAHQLGRGLVGPIIVDEREPSGFQHERVLSLKTWHVDQYGQFTEFMVPREAARGGTRGRLTTINGQRIPTLDMPQGQIVRLRILNLDNTITYRLNLPEGEARIYALDGHPIPPVALGKQFWLGPGMRIELAVRAPAAGQELSLRDGPMRLATLRGTPSEQAPGDWPAALPANPVAEPDLASAETIRFNFEWTGALSVGTSPTFWQINGQAWDIDDRSCVERPIATLQRDKSYIFELRNLSQYQHPIHLHGMAFKVLSSNRHRIKQPWFTDTYLLGRNETAKVALVADNPGTWMFHCHVIDHMETGLMAAIRVV